MTARFSLPAAEPAAVDLAEVDGARLQQLLEDDPVLRVFAGRHADGLTAFAMAACPRTSSGLVGFQSTGHRTRERSHAFDGLVDVPALIGVDHQLVLRSDLLAHEPHARGVVFGRRANLYLEMCPACGKRVAAQLSNPVV